MAFGYVGQPLVIIAAKLADFEKTLSGDIESEGSIVELTKLLTSKDAHVAHTAIHYSLQCRVDYVLATHLPSQTRHLATAVDESLRRAYKLCLGVDLLDEQGHTSTQGDKASVRDLFCMKARDGGGGFRLTMGRAYFLNAMNNAFMFIPEFWSHLMDPYFGGTASFEDKCEHRWRAFLASNSRFAAELESEWNRLRAMRQALVDGLAPNADGSAKPLQPSPLDTPAEGLGQGIVKLQRDIFNSITPIKVDLMDARARAMPRQDIRRKAYFEASRCSFSKVLMNSIPIASCPLQTAEFQSAVQNKFGVPQSLCRRLLGFRIKNHPNCPSSSVDLFGHNLKLVTGAVGGEIRSLHDKFVNVLSKWLKGARIPHKGGRCGTSTSCKGLFSHLVNASPNDSAEVKRIQNGIIPDIVIKGTAVEGSSFGCRDICTDVKTLAAGLCYQVESPEGARDTRAEHVNTQYHTHAHALDVARGTAAGDVGPIETELNKYGEGGKVIGYVVGAFGGVSKSIYDLADLVAEEKVIEYCSQFDMPEKQAKSLIKRKMYRELGLCAHRGWARVLLDRVVDLVEVSAAEDSWQDPEVEAATDYHDQFPDTRV